MSRAPGETVGPGGGWDRRAIVRVGLLWLVAANLRTVILALPPVLPTVRSQLHLSEAEVGLLTTLPVLLLGAGAVGGSAAVAHLGARRTLVIGCFAVGASSALRGAGNDVALFGGAVLLGLAIAVLQPVLPTVAQAWFGDRVALATAIYGNGFVGGEAIAASITLPLVVPLVGGWQGALAAWGLPCAVVAVVLATPIGAVPVVEGGSERWFPDLRDRWTWKLGAFQAGGSALYFGTNAYLPTELHAVGHAGLVAPCLAALNVSQLPAALVIAVLAHRGARTRPLMAACGTLAAAGIVLVIAFPGPVSVVGCGIVGLCAASSFMVALALPPSVAGPADVHRISAGMFLIGYVAAFVLPLLGGVIWDGTGQPRTAFFPGLVGALLIAVSLAGGVREGARDPVARLTPTLRTPAPVAPA